MNRVLKRAKHVVICLGLPALLTAAWPGPEVCLALDVEQILDRVHQRYAQVDFEADFVQEAHLKAMDMVDTASGRVYFRPPKMMRWQYLTPEEYLIVTDGKTVWMYKPQDNQVMTGPTEAYFGSDRGVDYFSNPRALAKEFTIELAPDGVEPNGRHVLRLVPNSPRSDLAVLYLFISKDDAEIIKAVTENTFGDRTILRFGSYKYNQGRAPSFFTFDVPKGVEVIESGGGSF